MFLASFFAGDLGAGLQDEHQARTFGGGQLVTADHAVDLADLAFPIGQTLESTYPGGSARTLRSKRRVGFFPTLEGHLQRNWQAGRGFPFSVHVEF